MNADNPAIVDQDALSCVAPTADKLDGLGAGCFVRVSKPEGCFWAEIIGNADDGHFIGTIHRELASDACRPPDGISEVSFGREEITLLGCDNHCWC